MKPILTRRFKGELETLCKENGLELELESRGNNHVALIFRNQEDGTHVTVVLSTSNDKELSAERQRRTLAAVAGAAEVATSEPAEKLARVVWEILKSIFC